jgi:hypothetical protein
VSLDEAVRDAREALARDERGHLQLGARRAMWAALGGRKDSGRCARTALAISASEHALPLWKATYPKRRATTFAPGTSELPSRPTGGWPAGGGAGP